MDPTATAYKVGAAVARRLPLPVISQGSAVASRVAMRMAQDRRVMIERHQRRVRPQLRDDELAAAVENVFKTYARYFTDTARLQGLDAVAVDDGFSYEGFEHIENGWAAGKGTMLVLPHLGGWEWAGSWLTKVPKYDVTAIVEPIENEELREWMLGLRNTIGMDIEPLGPKVGSTIMKRLRQGHIVCLMGDRNIGDGAVDVEFFGERTQLPGGPATLALRTGAAIVPVAVYHRDGKNHAIVEPPVPAERQGRLRADVERITQDIAHVLERQIRRAPDQWIVLQPNWPSDRALNHEHPPVMG